MTHETRTRCLPSGRAGITFLRQLSLSLAFLVCALGATTTCFTVVLQNSTINLDSGYRFIEYPIDPRTIDSAQANGLAGTASSSLTIQPGTTDELTGLSRGATASTPIIINRYNDTNAFATIRVTMTATIAISGDPNIYTRAAASCSVDSFNDGGTGPSFDSGAFGRNTGTITTSALVTAYNSTPTLKTFAGVESEAAGTYTGDFVGQLPHLNGKITHQVTATASVSCTFEVVGTPCPKCTSVNTVTMSQNGTTGATLDTNPNSGGGLRIYAERPKPSTSTAVQDTVRITANTDFPGQLVYFKTFDPDDPSSDVAPLDPNGPDGDDNNGTVAGLPSTNAGVLNRTSATTNSLGQVTVVLTVTHQPGDNFKVAASCSSGYLDSFSGEQVNHLDSAVAAISPLLTVWRHVHIELDHMATVHGNSIAGVISSAGNLGPKSYVVTTTALEYGRFENGYITIEGVGGFPVQSNANNLIFLSAPLTVSPAQLVGKHYTLVDDDDYNNNNGAVPTGDEGEDLRNPDTHLIQTADDPSLNVFAPAYVTPVYDLAGSTVRPPFIANTPDPGGFAEKINTYRFANSATEADPDCWTLYLLGAYQYVTSQDNDPNIESNRLTVVDNIIESLTFGAADNLNYKGVGASVFLEAIGNRKEIVPTTYINEAATVGHEVGHLFNGLHSDGGLMSQSSSRTSLSFSDQTLHSIRIAPHP